MQRKQPTIPPKPVRLASKPLKAKHDPPSQVNLRRPKQSSEETARQDDFMLKNGIQRGLVKDTIESLKNKHIRARTNERLARRPTNHQ